MEKVKIGGQWCSVPVLGDKVLENGERLRIRWPNGYEQEVRILVRTKPGRVGDHGHEYAVTDADAFVVIEHCGQLVPVNLAESEILCERMPVPELLDLDYSNPPRPLVKGRKL